MRFSVLFLLAPSLVFAQGNAQVSTTFNDASKESITDHLMLGLRSYNDSTRAYVLQDQSKKTMEGQEEFYAGLKWKSGWQIYAQAVQYAEVYGNQAKQNAFSWVPGDPSLSLVHPAIYQNYSTKVWGQLRAYIPGGSYSVSKNIHQYAYYSYAEYHPAPGWDVRNKLVPRYFSQPVYAFDDTTTYLEDRTSLSYHHSKALVSGLGQWSQLENHAALESGYCTEVYPFVEYYIAPKVSIGTSIYLPVMAHGEVWEGPTNVAIDNARAEISFTAGL